MDVVDRIFELVDAQFKEQKDFARVIGVSPSKVSQWRMRITQSYQKHLPQIAEALNTSTEYLLVGNEKQPATGEGDLSPDAYSVLAAYQQATPELQAAVRRVLGIDAS